jgi:hypothetical protein
MFSASPPEADVPITYDASSRDRHRLDRRALRDGEKEIDFVADRGFELKRACAASRPRERYAAADALPPIFGGQARTVGRAKRNPNRCLDNGSIC